MERARPAWLLVTLIAATVIGAGGVLLDMSAMVMSPMLFDAGESRWAWTMFYAIWTAPLVIIAGIVLGWVGFSASRVGVSVAGLVLVAGPLAGAIGLFAYALSS